MSRSRDLSALKRGPSNTSGRKAALLEAPAEEECSHRDLACVGVGGQVSSFFERLECQTGGYNAPRIPQRKSKGRWIEAFASVL